MPASSDERLHGVLLDLARTLVKSFDIGDILDSLCDNVVDLLPVTGAGVMLLERDGEPADGKEAPDGRLVTVAASDARIHVIERLQIELGEGPCLEAWRTSEQVLAGDLVASEPRWPRFGPAAVQLGLKAVHSFPLRFGGTALGALNLFSQDPLEFGTEDARLAQLLGDIATAYVVNARVHGEQAALAAQLQHALDSRVVIEQAKGKLSEQLGVDVDTAFGCLRAFARNHGLRLREVARQVVDGTLALTAGDGVSGDGRGGSWDGKAGRRPADGHAGGRSRAEGELEGTR